MKKVTKDEFSDWESILLRKLKERSSRSEIIKEVDKFVQSKMEI